MHTSSLHQFSITKYYNCLVQTRSILAFLRLLFLIIINRYQVVFIKVQNYKRFHKTFFLYPRTVVGKLKNLAKIWRCYWYQMLFGILKFPISLITILDSDFQNSKWRIQCGAQMLEKVIQSYWNSAVRSFCDRWLR